MCCALTAILASNVAGELTINVRALTAAGDLDSDNFVAVTPDGLTKMQIWAVVTNNDGNVRNDGLCKFYSSFRSTTGGLILGNLISVFPDTGPHSMWGGGPTANKGVTADLDGDGDNDIGSNAVGAPAPPIFQARASDNIEFFTDKDVPEFDEELWLIGAGPSEAEVEAWKVAHDTNEWFVARLYFKARPDWNEPIDPANGRPGVVEIWAEPRQYGAAAWKEDGLLKFNFVDPAAKDRGFLVSGDRTRLGVASEAHGPDGGPEGFKVAPTDDPLTLDGSASTGSINWWAWDFDGDGDYDLEGVGEVVDVTYDMLKGLVDANVTEGEEWPDGVMKTATMTVGWSASDPVNMDTTTFNLTLVPEPATVALLAVGLVTLIRRRK